jgi:hypothetical protein
VSSRQRNHGSYPLLHFSDKVPRVAVAIRGFRWSSRDDLLFGGEDLIAEEIGTSEGYTECKDSDVRGGRDGHCGRYKQSQKNLLTKKKREPTGRLWSTPSPGRALKTRQETRAERVGVVMVRGTFPRNIFLSRLFGCR